MLDTLLLTALIAGVSSAVQAISGFGFALLSVPLLTLIMPTQDAVIVSSLMSLVLTIGASIRERLHADWPTVRVIMVAAIVGMPFGLFLLETLPERALTALVGASVLASTSIVWRRPALPDTRTTRLALGALTGVLTTSTGTNGPPLVAAFQNMGYAPQRFRATLSAILAACGLVGLGFFAYGDELTLSSAALTAAAVPAIAIGWVLGDRVFHRIDGQHFRDVVLIALVVASAVTLVRALT